MINLVKQDELKQLPDEDYQQWCHDLMIIKRVVTAITSFIWHTTGSGKTLTSFKASQLIMKMPDVENHQAR